MKKPRKKERACFGPLEEFGETKTEARTRVEFAAREVLEALECLPMPMQGPPNHPVQWIAFTVHAVAKGVTIHALKADGNVGLLQTHNLKLHRFELRCKAAELVAKYALSSQMNLEEVDELMQWAQRYMLATEVARLRSEVCDIILKSKLYDRASDEGYGAQGAHAIMCDAPHLVEGQRAFRSRTLLEILGQDPWLAVTEVDNARVA